MRLPKSVIEWLPAVVVTIVAIGAIAYFVRPTSEYVPLRLVGFRLQSDGPFHVGEQVTLLNGVCNDSAEPVGALVSIGFQPDPDPLAGPKVSVLEEEPVTFQPGVCVGSEPLRGPLPAAVIPGRWRIYVQITARGEMADELQRLTETTQPFTVIP